MAKNAASLEKSKFLARFLHKIQQFTDFYSWQLLAIMLSIGVLCWQDEVQSQPAGMTLSTAWQMVEQKNLSLQQLEKVFQQTQQEVAIQKNGYLPTLAFNSSYNYVSELAQLELPFQLPGVGPIAIKAGVQNQYDFALVVKQPLFTGFRTKNLISSVQEQQQASRLQKTILLNSLRLQVGQLFYNLQLNLLQQQVLLQGIQRADFQLEKVRNFFRAQQATQFDTLEVANRKLQWQIQLQKLQSVYNILVSKFCYVLNEDSLPPILRIQLESFELSLAELPDYQQQAIAHRPELQQIDALQRAQGFRLKTTRSVFFPQLFANATYHYARPGVNIFKDRWMDYYTVGLNLQWELWNWRSNQRKVEQTQLELQRVSLQAEQLRRDVLQQVTEAYQYLQATKEQISLQRNLLNQEAERYRLVQEKYAQSSATTLDLSSAEKTLTEADLLLQQNYIEWFQYKLLLDYATGVIGK